MKRISMWVAHHLPPTLLHDTERFGLSLTFIIVGGLSAAASLSGVRGDQVRIEQVVPKWIFLEWTATLVIGGVATIIGMMASARQLERFGISLAMVGCATYGLSLVSVGWHSPRQLVVGSLFLILAGVKFIRLCVSTAGSYPHQEDA